VDALDALDALGVRIIALGKAGVLALSHKAVAASWLDVLRTAYFANE
jgi:hypothetical protein